MVHSPPPAVTRTRLIDLLRRASGVVSRGQGIDYLQLSAELAQTAETIAELGRLGPKPPGVSLERWVRLSQHDKRAMIAQYVEFYEFHHDRVERRCPSCGEGSMDVALPEVDGATFKALRPE